MHDPLNLGRQCWAMLSDLYVKCAVGEVEKELGEVHHQLRLLSKVSMLLSAGYRPEVDGTKLLGARQASYFQGLIGVLQWICELGRIDILHDVAVLLQFLVAPREGNLEQCLHIFAYLKKYKGLRYKLWMMGIEIDGLTSIFCDNGSMVTNTMRLESMLKKKHNAIAYHHVHEAQATGIVRIAHKDSETNLSNVLTKSLPGPRLHELIHIYFTNVG